MEQPPSGPKTDDGAPADAGHAGPQVLILRDGRDGWDHRRAPEYGIEEIPDSDAYVNQALTTSACCVELSAHSPQAGRDSVTAWDLRELPCVLVASPEQRDNEMTYYRDIVGLEGEFPVGRRLFRRFL